MITSAPFLSRKSRKNLEAWRVKLLLYGALRLSPDTDDIREAPALYVIEQLIEAGAGVRAFDPEAMDNVRKTIGDDISYFEDQYAALDGADALIICTEWSVFRTPDFPELETRLKNKVIFDGRNLYDNDHMKDRGFKYFSIGR